MNAAIVPETHDAQSVGQLARSVMGVFMMAAMVLLLYLLASLWPSYVAEGDDRVLQPAVVNLLWWKIPVTADEDLRLLLLVAVSGAIGSFIHAATSFVSYVGNRTLVRSWLWWYVLRMPIGTAIALLFYFLLRGGLLSAGADAGDVSLFGMIAVGGIAGMFSKQASDKLKELFDNLFRVGRGYGDDERLDKLDEDRPVMDRFEPPNIAAGGADRVVKIIGRGLPKDCKVFIGDQPRRSRVVSGTEIEFTLEDGDVAQAAELTIYLVGASGQRLNERKLRIT